MGSNGPAYEVGAYADLEGCHLASAGKDRVLTALEDHGAVVWLEDWLRSEKPLETLPGAQGLYGCTLTHETDSAWCVEQPGGDEVWVPKSCAELYQRAEDGLEDESGSPQSSLGEFAPK
jgi:hypothetical protein